MIKIKLGLFRYDNQELKITQTPFHHPSSFPTRAGETPQTRTPHVTKGLLRSIDANKVFHLRLGGLNRVPTANENSGSHDMSMGRSCIYTEDLSVTHSLRPITTEAVEPRTYMNMHLLWG